MKYPDISILIAHKRNPGNDKALAVAIQTFIDTTTCDYELLVDATTPRDPYQVYNELAAQAKAPYLLFANSDTFAGQGWVEAMLPVANADTIVAPILVECGAIGVHVMNFRRSFGMTPETFQANQFNQWIAEGGEWRDGEGWYMPTLHPRETFLSVGGFDTSLGAFGVVEIDQLYWTAWRKAGHQVRRVKAWFYHLQNWSNEAEQQKAVRHP